MAKKTEINEKQKRFCNEYIIDLNATRAYQIAYPDASYETANANGHKLLVNASIKAYINKIKNKLEEQAGITRLGVLLEYKKMAFSSIAHLHDSWIERKEFENLTEEQKSCIAEIQTQTRSVLDDNDNRVQIDFVKIKLYDKQKSLDSIAKMLGYNEPDKVDHGGITIEIGESAKTLFGRTTPGTTGDTGK